MIDFSKVFTGVSKVHRLHVFLYLFLIFFSYMNIHCGSVGHNLPAQLTNILALRDEYKETDYKVLLEEWEEETRHRAKKKHKTLKKPQITQAIITLLYCELLGKVTISKKTGKRVGQVFVYDVLLSGYTLSHTLSVGHAEIRRVLGEFGVGGGGPTTEVLPRAAGATGVGGGGRGRA